MKMTTLCEKGLVINGRNQAHSNTQKVEQHQTYPHHFLQTPNTHPGPVHTLKPPRHSAQDILSDRKGVLCGMLGPSLPTLFTVSVKSTAQPSDSLLGAHISFLSLRRSPLILSQLSWQRPCCVHLQSLSLPCLGIVHELIFTHQECWKFFHYPREII